MIKTEHHNCVLQSLKRISGRDRGGGRETCTFRCLGCGAVFTVKVDSTLYRDWEKLQQGKKRDSV